MSVPIIAMLLVEISVIFHLVDCCGRGNMILLQIYYVSPCHNRKANETTTMIKLHIQYYMQEFSCSDYWAPLGTCNFN